MVKPAVDWGVASVVTSVTVGARDYYGGVGERDGSKSAPAAECPECRNLAGRQFTTCHIVLATVERDHVAALHIEAGWVLVPTGGGGQRDGYCHCWGIVGVRPALPPVEPNVFRGLHQHGLCQRYVGGLRNGLTYA